MFATGIENSYPTIQDAQGKTIRQDELEKTNHYERWRDDFERLRELGIEYLRYGPPYFSVHRGPGKYDWDFTDTVFGALEKQGTKPIVDLCHFGVPDWIGNFQNPDWPELFAEFAGAFAQRFPWVRFYTPVNEIFIAATFSGQFGWWNERLASDKGFVTALKHLCKANLMAMRAILKERPDAIFIQSESTQYFHSEDPDCSEFACFYNAKRFLSLDLSYGHHVDASMYRYLTDHGMTRAEYEWLHANHVKSRCVMGNDYYATNENMVHADGTITMSGEILGYYPITYQYFRRYNLPVMHTETNYDDPNAVNWLRKEWANVHILKERGVPIIGFTWYSLQDQVDWDTGLRENNGRVNPLGLCDLDRKIRPVGYAYKKLIEKWSKTLPNESNVLGIGV